MAKNLEIKNISFYQSILLFFLLIIVLVIFDNIINPPFDQPSSHLVLLLFDEYDNTLSGIKKPKDRWRFIPTCSDYMGRAVLKHGSIIGVIKGVFRLTRCSPLTKKRGLDYP